MEDYEKEQFKKKLEVLSDDLEDKFDDIHDKINDMEDCVNRVLNFYEIHYYLIRCYKDFKREIDNLKKQLE